MKKFILYGLLLLPLCTTVCLGKTLYVKAETANIRSGPSTKYPIVEKVSKATELSILDYQKEWSKVRLPNKKIGWINRKLLTEQKPILSTKEQKEKYHRQGTEYASRGTFDQAKNQFQEALKLDKFYYPAKVSLKILNDIARGEITKNIAVLLFKGVKSEIEGDPDQAIQDYTKAITINVQYAEAYNNRGTAYLGKGNYDHAIKDYTKAIAINPQLAEAYYSRGGAYASRRDYDQAIKDCTKAITINPQYAAAYYCRGLGYYHKGDYTRAKNDWQKALSLDPYGLAGQSARQNLSVLQQQGY